jgi:Tol biopolymer transport system component
MKHRTFRHGLWLLPLVSLFAPAARGEAPPAPTAVAKPNAKPQIVFEGPGIPGDASEQELFISKLNGSGVAQITNDGHNKFLAHFSPDGTRLVYTKFLSGHYGDPNAETDIFTYTFATGAETRLTALNNAYQPAWSPDGQHIVFGNYDGTGLYLMNADGSGQFLLAQPSGAPDDVIWHDIAWSNDNWIFFVVKQVINNCFKVRVDKIRPDGSSRTKVSDGGPTCTPPGMEQYGDADPGLSADGKTVYSSRGLSPLPADPSLTLRHLYAFSSDAYYPGKVETDLSLAEKPDCIVGVPKGAPRGKGILVFLFCPDDSTPIGVTLTNTKGSLWKFVSTGFGPDWNPTTRP